MKNQDQDMLALKQCVKALDRSSSKRMLRANLEFLWDRYISNPKANKQEKASHQ